MFNNILHSLYMQHIQSVKHRLKQIKVNRKILILSNYISELDKAFFKWMCPIHDIDNLYIIVEIKNDNVKIAIAYDTHTISSLYNVSFHGDEVKRIEEIHNFFDNINTNFNISSLTEQYIIVQCVHSINSSKLIYDEHTRNVMAMMLHEKTKYEIYCICKANEMAMYAHKRVQKYFRLCSHSNEIDIYKKYIQHINDRAESCPYSPIVSINKHSSIIHYKQLSDKRVQIYSLLIDAGAKYNAYCSDITYTYSKEYTAKIAIKKITTIQKNIIKYIRKRVHNIRAIDINEFAKQVTLNALKKLNLITHSADRNIQSKLYSLFTVHSVCHSIGINVHDMYHITKKYPANNICLAIEPGIYFIEKLISNISDNVKKHINFTELNKYTNIGGIRMETNIVIYEHRVFNLSNRRHVKMLLNMLTAN